MPLKHSIERARVAWLNDNLAHLGAIEVMRAAYDLIGNVALVSSFGAESAVLLRLLAQIDPERPVLFVDTQMLFEETLQHQKRMAEFFGLSNIQVIRAQNAQAVDPHGQLHQHDADSCCTLRKTAPLHQALAQFDGWISGRKRHQARTRQNLELFEFDDDSGKIKINPLAFWSANDIQRFMNETHLPRHPLVAKGYPSIGCAPCTTKVNKGEDPRAGRWRNSEKEECGIHFVNGKMVRTGAQI